MTKWAPWVALALLLVAAAMRLPAQNATLEAADYIEIETLYARNTLGYDSATENGEMYARTFVADGVLVRPSGTVTGRKDLAALAAMNTPALRQWVSNLTIDPARGGATGWAYVMTVNGTRAEDLEGGLYRDELVKTSEGWRFKKRTYAPGHRIPGGVPMPGTK